MNISFYSPQFPKNKKLEEQTLLIQAGFAQKLNKNQLGYIQTKNGNWFAIKRLNGNFIVTGLYINRLWLLWALLRKTIKWFNL